MRRRKMPIASSGLRPSARLNSARKAPSLRNSAESIVAARSGTFSHLDVWRQAIVQSTLQIRNGQALHVRRGFERSLPLAIDRQAHGDARPGAEAAADREFAAVQRHQSLDNRQTEAGAVVRPVVGGAHLEEGIA